MNANKSLSWVILILLVGAIAGGSVYLWKTREIETNKTELQSQIDELEAKVETLPEEEAVEPEVLEKNQEENEDENPVLNPDLDLTANEMGMIEGGLSYPSEGIPPDLEVCAENMETNKIYCTKDHIEGDQFQYGEGYLIEVPAGSYQVYTFDRDTKAYYSEFVTCGLNVECPSHEPITIQVAAGDKVMNVNPWDWYDNQ